MNANRTKYASTPTYGMQKRGFMKKAPVRQAPETPDFPRFRSPPPPCRPLRRRRSRPSRSPSPLRVGFQACRPISPPPCRARRRFPSRRPASFSPWRVSRLFRALHRAPPHPCHRWATPHSAPLPRLSRRAVRALCPLRRWPPSLLPPPLRPCGRGNPNPFGPRYSPLCTPFLPCSPARLERRRRPCPATPLRGE